MIYDISQELFSCRVYPGDPAPERRPLLSMEDGQPCNLSALFLCAHNGTHVNAPFHFLPDGRTIDELGLEPFVGPCRVFRHSGEVTAADAERMLAQDKTERLLIAGPAVVTAEAARVFAAAGLRLVGNESQTVGPEDAPREVHLLLLGAGVVLLEGLVLDGVPEGRYLLNAAPLNLAGCDGSPCRAWLMTETAAE